MMVQIKYLFPGGIFLFLHTLMSLLAIVLELYLHNKFGESCVYGYNIHQGDYYYYRGVLVTKHTLFVIASLCQC